jgi:hypothetical protein
MLFEWAARQAGGVLGLQGTLWEWLVEYPYKLLAVAAAYAVFHRLLRLNWFNRFITRATPSHYFRRYHEPATNLRDLRGKENSR